MPAHRELAPGTWLWVCEPVVEIADQTEGAVPAYMPGEHPFKDEFGRKYYLPEVAVRGGAETMYPEFQSKVIEGRKSMPPPKPAAPAPAAGGQR